MPGQTTSVGIVMGGISSEHDVSLNSGLGMLSKIDRQKFSPFPILISPENKWVWPKDKKAPTSEFKLPEIKSILQTPPPLWETAHFPHFQSFPSCDIFLLALHGKGGEDGTLQKFLDERGQVYTGSGSQGSADAMDKISSKQIFVSHNIPTPPYTVLTDFSEKGITELLKKFEFPLVIKIPEGGSSIGVDIANTQEKLFEIVTQFSKLAPTLLVEKFIKGREATCGYIENGPPLIPTEIVPNSDKFFNYEAKYDASRTDEITPARFEAPILQEMQRLAQKCHHALGLSVYSRTDFFIKDGTPFVIEINSLPGFTSNSLMPKGAAAAGLEFTELLTKIIQESLKKSK